MTRTRRHNISVHPLVVVMDVDSIHVPPNHIKLTLEPIQPNMGKPRTRPTAKSVPDYAHIRSG